jgi:hypothetical protein
MLQKSMQVMFLPANSLGQIKLSTKFLTRLGKCPRLLP